MPRNNGHAIVLRYTEEEWAVLEQMVKEKGGRSFRSHLICSVHRIAKQIDVIIPEELPIEKKREARYILTPDISSKIISAAAMSGITPTAYISRYIASPLFREYLDKRTLLKG